MAVLKNTVSDGAIVLPSGTTAQRPASPEQGAIRFNTTLGVTEIYQWGGWVDAASGAEAPSAGYGNGCQTVCYIPMYGDTGTNADITDQVSGAVATLSGTTSRNYTRSGAVGIEFGGGYLDFTSPLLGNINNSALPQPFNGRRFWTVEFWVYNTGGAGGGTYLEWPYYPNGLMIRNGNNATDHYWRGSTINAGMTFSINTWTHIAAVGYGDNIRFYENGTQKYDGMNAVATSAFPDPHFQPSPTYAPSVGLSLMCSNHTTRGAQYTTGTLRKFRISLGARYLGAFTSSQCYPL
jgi:hypothetical protein